MYEPIGIAATLFVLIAFCMNNQRHIRIFDAIGAALFVLYGFFIHSASTVILNCVLIVIHVHKLYGHQGGDSNGKPAKPKAPGA